MKNWSRWVAVASNLEQAFISAVKQTHKSSMLAVLSSSPPHSSKPISQAGEPAPCCWCPHWLYLLWPFCCAGRGRRLEKNGSDQDYWVRIEGKLPWTYGSALRTSEMWNWSGCRKETKYQIDSNRMCWGDALSFARQSGAASNCFLSHESELAALGQGIVQIQPFCKHLPIQGGSTWLLHALQPIILRTGPDVKWNTSQLQEHRLDTASPPRGLVWVAIAMPPTYTPARGSHEFIRHRINWGEVSIHHFESQKAKACI